MKLRLHPLYKNLLLLAMVLGPLYWLILTEDGQIRTDVVLLTLFGKPELNLTIERLNSDLTEAQLRALFPDLTLDCEAVETPFGDRACRVEIGIFNSVPARAFTLFLEDDQVRAARVDYRPRSQGALESQFRHRLGVPGQRDAAHPETQTWQAEDGLVLMPATKPADNSQAALFWLSAAALRGRGDGGAVY
jgi:hypothetical protein